MSVGNNVEKELHLQVGDHVKRNENHPKIGAIKELSKNPGIFELTNKIRQAESKTKFFSKCIFKK